MQNPDAHNPTKKNGDLHALRRRALNRKRVISTTHMTSEKFRVVFCLQVADCHSASAAAIRWCAEWCWREPADAAKVTREFVVLLSPMWLVAALNIPFYMQQKQALWKWHVEPGKWNSEPLYNPVNSCKSLDSLIKPFPRNTRNNSGAG